MSPRFAAICVPRSKKSPDGGQYPVEPSVFVREIPKELIEEQTLYSAPEPTYGRRRWDDDDDDYGGGYGGRRGGYGGYGGRGGYGGGSGGGGRRGGGSTTYKSYWRH